MNTELIPAVVAAGGGSALLAGIWAHEYRRDEAMRASRVRLSMRFPLGVDPAAARSALSGLAGLPDRMELVFETAITPEGVAHCLVVPSAVRASVVSTMTGALPGLRLAEAPELAGRAALSLRVFVPTPTVLVSETPHATLAALAGLALRPGERVLVRWAIRPGSPRQLRSAAPDDRAGREAERAWQQKTAIPGFQVSGLVLVQSPGSARAKTLIGHVASVIRSRRGHVGGPRMTAERSARSLTALPRTTRASGWLNVAESLPLLSWPIGDRPVPGVELGAARELAVPRHVPRHGRRLFVGRDANGERPVALGVEAASTHLAVLGKTGAGKSSVLGGVVLDALAAGHGGVLIDPKDLVAEVLDRVPAQHAERIAVLDPASTEPLPGLDLFGTGDSSLRADVLLSVLKGLSEGWGPRIDQYLRMGLRTVATLPDPVLFDWLRLYSDPALRRSAIARLDDPVLVAEWRTYEESLSAAEQFQHIAPAVSRITSLLSRPALRAVLSQPNPKLNIGRLLEEGKWLLVSLSPGVLGEPAARLLSGIVTYLVWAAIEARVKITPDQRRPVVLVLDELQSLASLPVGLEVFFERTRSMNCAVVAATQTAARLPESTRQSLFGNVGSLLTFKMGYDEAARLSRELPGLTAQDLMSLGRFEVAARISTGGLGSGSAVVTGRTEPLPPVTGQAAVIRALSAARYGTDPREVEDELRRRSQSQPDPISSEIGQARRAI